MKGNDWRRKAEIAATRPLRSYGRRKTKPLSARKERLIGELLPLIRVDLANEAPSPLHGPLSRSGQRRLARDRLRFGRASACGRPSVIRTSASSVASPSSMAWEASSAPIDERGIARSACMTGMRARCSPGSPTARSAGSSCSSPIPGPSGAIRSGGSWRARRSASSPACSRPAANSDLLQIAATMPRRRSLLVRAERRLCLDGGAAGRLAGAPCRLAGNALRAEGLKRRAESRFTSRFDRI